jgi:hypothetical protein
MEETPSFKAAQAKKLEAAAGAAGYESSEDSKLTIISRYGMELFGTAGTWFLMDITFYAHGLFSASVLKNSVESASGGGSGPGGAMTQHDKLMAMCVLTVYMALMALPGYWLSVLTTDWLGRRRLQLFGFVGMAACFFALGFSLQHARDVSMASSVPPSRSDGASEAALLVKSISSPMLPTPTGMACSSATRWYFSTSILSPVVFNRPPCLCLPNDVSIFSSPSAGEIVSTGPGLQTVGTSVRVTTTGSSSFLSFHKVMFLFSEGILQTLHLGGGSRVGGLNSQTKEREVAAEQSMFAPSREGRVGVASIGRGEEKAHPRTLLSSSGSGSSSDWQAAYLRSASFLALYGLR